MPPLLDDAAANAPTQHSAGRERVSGDELRTPSDADTVRPGPDPDPATSGTLARGRLVGRFVVIDRIGRGGMGEVHLAYDPELDRRVALKLVHGRVSNDAAGSARLLREAQALAQLNHPNVVTIHDVGRTPEGIYVAMEYVDGQTLSTWLRQDERRLQPILEVFVAAGRGIAAAHDVGLVHRDIKPDNIMIGRDGRVRVLDFGLARAVAPPSLPSLSEPTEAATGRGDSGSRSLDVSLTATGEIMGTPLYMSPEQYRGREVDARSDVYALGVALWEAVWGTRPFAGQTLAELAANVTAGRIRSPTARDGAPPRPVPPWLRRALHRAIALDPVDRFADMRSFVAELARDRGRWRAPALAAAVFGGTAAVLFATMRTTAPCENDPEALRGAWDEPRRDAIAAVFAGSTQAWAATSAATVTARLDDYARQLVDGRREACEATHVHGTQSPATLDRRIACIERRVGEFDGLTRALAQGGDAVLEHAVTAANALPQVAACADPEAILREPALPDDPLLRRDVDDTRSELAAIGSAISLHADASLEPRIEAALARARGLGYAPLEVDALMVRGRWQRRRALPAPAAASFTAAFETALACGYERAIAHSASELVLVESGLDDRFDAAEIYGRIATGALARLGNPLDLRIPMLTDIGHFELVRGRLDAALASLSLALELADTSEDPAIHDDPFLFHAMARAFVAAKRYEDAERMIDRMTATLALRVGERHPDYGLAVGDRAMLRTAQDRPAEGLALWQQAYDIAVAAHGPNHTEVAAARNGMGLALSDLGRDAEAEAQYAAGLEVAIQVLGDSHHNVAAGLGNLGAVQLRLGRAAPARANLERALQIRLEGFGELHDTVGKTLDLLGDAQRDLGDLDAAAASYRRALSVFEQLGGRDDPRRVYASIGLAEVLESQQHPDEAAALLEHALRIQPERAPPQRRAALRFALARVIVDHDRARALELAEAARRAYVEAGPRWDARAAALAQWRRDH